MLSRVADKQIWKQVHSLRWSDAFETFVKSLDGMEGDDWLACAQCEQSWDELEDAFCYADSSL